MAIALERFTRFSEKQRAEARHSLDFFASQPSTLLEVAVRDAVSKVNQIQYWTEHAEVSILALTKDRDFYVEKADSLEAQITSLEAQITSLERSLAATQYDLEKIHSSRSWRILTKARKMFRTSK